MLNQLLVGVALFLLLALPSLLIVGALALDGMTRRGFGLALLAVVLIGLTIWIAVSFEQAVEQSHGPYYLGFAHVADYIIGSYLVLWLWGGALIEARAARQWPWVVGLVVAGLVPILNAVENNLLHLGAHSTAVAGGAELLFLMLLPSLAVLIYGLVRSVWPVKPGAGAAAG
ncbi:MAG TPA: hypothetical protein VGP82_14520 [Ktedonobacterales bacterium]|jgi:hypothetical protein|nr:hypothetical protein [Ktedonobacterales bacterium]